MKACPASADRADEPPVWVTVWGGPNTLAQALWDVRASRSAAETETFVAKLRIYAISDQDDSGPWLRREFPNLFYIVTPSNPATSLEYYRATWTGISGGRGEQTAAGYHFDLVDLSRGGDACGGQSGSNQRIEHGGRASGGAACGFGACHPASRRRRHAASVCLSAGDYPGDTVIDVNLRSELCEDPT